ncbi:unnamed protein product [Larinioides sclopetarius]|uniref:Uncharacterized protein n=1 Tax=Larinioides sclopetarius TaxID=280406 RepID=A0AAV2BNR6_9ARAC
MRPSNLTQEDSARVALSTERLPAIPRGHRCESMFFEASLRKTLDVNILYPRPNQGLQISLKRNPKVLNEQLHKKTKLFSSFLVIGANSANLDSSTDLSEVKHKFSINSFIKKKYKAVIVLSRKWTNSACLDSSADLSEAKPKSSQ